MADPDQFLSNGSCYWGPFDKSVDDFIPCGNWLFGHIHCCQAGDKCLAHGACYNDKHGTTYLTGCSDFSYKHSNCPDKKSYRDYPWAGLIYCKPNKWVACREKFRPTVITTGDKCECPTSTEDADVAFAAANPIESIGRLPTAVGEPIEWFAGHLPTGRPTSTMSASTPDSSGGSSGPEITIPSNTPTSTNDGPSQDTGLSDGAKAGIGIGAAVGTILILGALSALWVVLRRRKSDKNIPDFPETTRAAAPGPSDKPPGAGPAEMPTPDVSPRPLATELPGGP